MYQHVRLYNALQTLEKVSSQYQASYQEAVAEYNFSKNRFPDKTTYSKRERMGGKKEREREKEREGREGRERKRASTL